MSCVHGIVLNANEVHSSMFVLFHKIQGLGIWNKWEPHKPGSERKMFESYVTHCRLKFNSSRSWLRKWVAKIDVDFNKE